MELSCFSSNLSLACIVNVCLWKQFDLPFGLWFRTQILIVLKFCNTWLNIFYYTKQIPPPFSFIIKYVWPIQRLYCHYADTSVPLMSTNTLRRTFKHTTLKIVCYCWFRFNQRTQDNFILNNILHYCHCLFTYSVFTTWLCLWSFFFSYKKIDGNVNKNPN